MSSLDLLNLNVLPFEIQQKYEQKLMFGCDRKKLWLNGHVRPKLAEWTNAAEFTVALPIVGRYLRLTFSLSRCGFGVGSRLKSTGI